MYDWESELPALAALSDQEAATAINAMAVQDKVFIFGSFRTLAALLTPDEYNTLRTTLNAASAGNLLLQDMIEMLRTPGNEQGNGGGLALNAPGFVAMLGQLCLSESLAGVPDKIAAYVASLQPPPRSKYSHCEPGEVWAVRNGRTG